MKHKLSTTLALVVLTMAFAAATARAQTVANGPYYAPPAWDQTLPAATRFIVLSNMGSNAVLDRETGLVWEKSPLSPSGAETGLRDWLSAQDSCNRKTVGNRKGWRLPTLQELTSLVDGDPANTSSPRLPPGHPFTIVPSFLYWSATAGAKNTSSAWVVTFIDGGMASVDRSLSFFVWCVRGGQGVDAQ
jgi:hypothetical protein